MFFFFQAEDGIRDKLVTGVQTCALPIFDPGDQAGGARERRDRARLEAGGRGRVSCGAPLLSPREGPACRPGLLPRHSPRQERSEERRVGKSVDLGGRRIIKKKKKKQVGR